MPDVDIDFYNREGVLELFKHTSATIVKDNKHEKHKTGIYFHDIPVNPITKNASLDYKKAEGRGYFKIDLLNSFNISAIIECIIWTPFKGRMKTLNSTIL